MRFWIFLFIFTVGFLSGCIDKPLRQVVLITFDALRADHLSCYGYHQSTSPNIDGFASDAVIFKYPTAQAPWTDGSLASLHTGRYTYEVYYGTKGYAHPINPQINTLAELARDSGLYTVAMVANARLFEGMGWNRGFDEYHELFLEAYGISLGKKNGDVAPERAKKQKKEKRKITAAKVTDNALSSLLELKNRECFRGD